MCVGGTIQHVKWLQAPAGEVRITLADSVCTYFATKFGRTCTVEAGTSNQQLVTKWLGIQQAQFLMSLLKLQTHNFNYN